jgi:Uma2 family endonuclease
MTPLAASKPAIFYPDSDGKPMADNTLQFEWIVTIQGGIDALFLNNPDVFVAGNLLWYALEGDPRIRVAPDVMVVFGRPKGYRGSYQQWNEGEIAPQVVLEVQSPGNRFGEMLAKFNFYQRYAVEEYYLYDPDHGTLEGWQRSGNSLIEIPNMIGWISPRLGVRFDLVNGELVVTGPDGRRFATYVELVAQREAAERARRDAERAQQDAERQATEARDRADRLAAQLRALGVEPEA